jgi:hypothetical protein
MSENTAEGLKSSLNEPASSVEATVDNFVETTVNALRQSEAPESAVSAVQEAGVELSETVSATAESAAQARSRARETEQRVAELKQTVEELRDDQDDHTEDLRENLRDERESRARADAEIKQRVTDVEQRVDDLEGDHAGANPGDDGEETTMQEPVTPLEDLVTLPEAVIDQESANTRRAVFVAKDVDEYTTSVPAGRMITSSELRRVLTAGTDASGHTQTVSRVIDLLDDLGGDDVEIVDRRGTRKLVFTDNLVDRLTELTSRQQSHCRDPVSA